MNTDWLGLGIVGLLPLLALLTVLQRKLLHGIIARGMFGLAASLVYAFLGAPDVAVTEALMGALLVTFLYVVAVKSAGIVKIGFLPLHPMIEETNTDVVGLEADILKAFCKENHLKGKFHRFETEEELKKALREGIVDIACGGLMEKGGSGLLSFPFLRTRVVYLPSKNMELDLLRARAKIYNGELKTHDLVPGEETRYVFILGEEPSDLAALFADFMQTHEKSIEELVKKHLGGDSE
ncbi:MAG: DUF4040 domain-containing protein [Thermotogae bacterium]|nr:DUF4040 domain-containing protein [Thermotogota bacterium]